MINLALQLIAVSLGVVGIVFNIFKKKVCYMLWGIHALAWLILYYRTGFHWSTMGYCLINIGMYAVGWNKWRKDEHISKTERKILANISGQM